MVRCSALVLLLVSLAWSQEELLPDGQGKAETLKLCRQCHELQRSIAPRQDRAGWSTTIAKMTALGMKATTQEVSLVLEYLVSNYPPGEVPRVNVNTARAIELESGLSLRRSQAAALIKFREEHGPFKSLEDLKKVPVLDAAKLDEKKDKITF